jgi:large conductance mechanosensitive channel
MVRWVNRLRKPVAVAVAGPSNEEKLLTEIRDLLKAGK